MLIKIYYCSVPLDSVADIAGLIPPGSMSCYLSLHPKRPARGTVFTAVCEQILLSSRSFFCIE